MVYHRIAFFIVFQFLVFQAFSQHHHEKNNPDRPLRVEISVTSDNETHRVIPCGPDGILLFFRSQESFDEANIKWYFSYYNQNLEQVWVKSYPIPKGLDIRDFQSKPDTVTLLYCTSGKTKDRENSFQILRIDCKHAMFLKNSGNYPLDGEISFFGVQKEWAWIGINSKGEAGKIIQLDLNKGQLKNIVLGEGNQIVLRYMKPDSSAQFVTAIVSRFLTKKTSEHYLVHYDTTGKISYEVLLSSQQNDHDLNRFQIARTPDGSDLLFGSYTQGGSGNSGKNKFPDESTGFFSSRIQNKSQKEIKYFNFLEFKNANILLSEKDILSLKKKALKKNKSLGEYSLDFSLIIHDPITWKNQLILIGEVISPQYHTENFTEFDYYGRPYTNSYSVFDGYRFVNAIVAGFDLSGNLLWDNAMEIRNIISFERLPKLIPYFSGDDLILCYSGDGKIATKIIRMGEVIEKLDFSPNELRDPEDKLINESKSKLFYWYDNYFISSGYQEIKNIALVGNNRRLVFFFNKLRFEK
ncbi:MAG: hypothetical protein PHF97_00245 [Bacteroidales bacterium]|nr:hypothetical protein [Bacteroidales bacterium]